jgi:hypothetical protein
LKAKSNCGQIAGYYKNVKIWTITNAHNHSYISTEQKYKKDPRPTNHTKAPDSELFIAPIGKNAKTTDHVIVWYSFN